MTGWLKGDIGKIQMVHELRSISIAAKTDHRLAKPLDWQVTLAYCYQSIESVSTSSSVSRSLIMPRHPGRERSARPQALQHEVRAAGKLGS
jgi:hypothetical protein